MHILLLLCLSALLCTSLFGISHLLHMLFDHFAVPFSALLACAAGMLVLWGVILGICYGVAHA